MEVPTVTMKILVLITGIQRLLNFCTAIRQQASLRPVRPALGITNTPLIPSMNLSISVLNICYTRQHRYPVYENTYISSNERTICSVPSKCLCNYPFEVKLFFLVRILTGTGCFWIDKVATYR